MELTVQENNRDRSSNIYQERIRFMKYFKKTKKAHYQIIRNFISGDSYDFCMNKKIIYDNESYIHTYTCELCIYSTRNAVAIR